jgi:hypothetical protein
MLIRRSLVSIRAKNCDLHRKCVSQALAISQKNGIVLFFLRKKGSEMEKMCIDTAIPLDTFLSLG